MNLQLLEVGIIIALALYKVPPPRRRQQIRVGRLFTKLTLSIELTGDREAQFRSRNLQSPHIAALLYKLNLDLLLSILGLDGSGVENPKKFLDSLLYSGRVPC